jgi:hypothetical protein
MMNGAVCTESSRESTGVCFKSDIAVRTTIKDKFWGQFNLTVLSNQKVATVGIYRQPPGNAVCEDGTMVLS